MFKKKPAQKQQEIVTISNYTGKNYVLKDGKFTPLGKPTLKSNNFFITYLANKDMIIAPVEISQGILDEDLDGALENRAYEELGLDPSLEYMIHHHEIPNQEGERLFQLFIVEKNKFEDIFSELRAQVKYIDLIRPAPLLYKSIYESGLVASKGVQCYLYFAQYDTFLAFYRDGEYLYSKSINYSFRQIFDKYCEMSGKTADEAKFYEVLQKEGMKTTEADFQQHMMKLFGEIFISINDIIIYTKRAYELDVIDQVYIGSELGPIIGLDDYAQNYLGLNSSELSFEFEMDSGEWYTDQFQYLMATDAERYLRGEEELLNLTLYPRPPVFFKRTSGQFVAATLAAMAVALVYPAIYFVGANLNEAKIYALKKEAEVLGKEAVHYRRLLKARKAEIGKLDKQISELKTIFTNKEKTLTSVYRKKVDYRLKSEQLQLFAGDLAAYEVKTSFIATHKDNYQLSLLSENDEKITQLIKHISQRYYQDITLIDIEVIDKNSTFYQGILKVNLR